jgi:S1-C subfamily serine protease
MIPVKIASADYESDRCVLEASDVPPTHANIRNSTGIDVGEEAYSIGSPSGLDLTIADGLVSGKRMIRGVLYLQTTAPISKGSSGGGLFDRTGRLMGITTFYVDGGQNLNFAIAADQF